MDISTYIEKHGESLSAFARRCELSRQTLQNLVNGDGARVDTAIQIVDASSGEIDWRTLGTWEE